MKTKNGIRELSEAEESKAYEKWLRQVSNFPNWDKMNSDTYDFEENEREKRGNESFRMGTPGKKQRGVFYVCDMPQPEILLPLNLYRSTI